MIFDGDSIIEIKVDKIMETDGKRSVSLAIKAPQKYKIIREPM